MMAAKDSIANETMAIDFNIAIDEAMAKEEEPPAMLSPAAEISSAAEMVVAERADGNMPTGTLYAWGWRLPFWLTT
jgi:hypothetical protein